MARRVAASPHEVFGGRGRYGLGMRVPLIGVAAAVERATWSVWDQSAVLLTQSYLRAIQRAGAVAVMLPPDPLVARQPDLVLDLLDALLLAGGADVDPLLYGAQRAAETHHGIRERAGETQKAVG